MSKNKNSTAKRLAAARRKREAQAQHGEISEMMLNIKGMNEAKKRKNWTLEDINAKDPEVEW